MMMIDAKRVLGGTHPTYRFRRAAAVAMAAGKKL